MYKKKYNKDVVYLFLIIQNDTSLNHNQLKQKQMSETKIELSIVDLQV